MSLLAPGGALGLPAIFRLLAVLLALGRLRLALGVAAIPSIGEPRISEGSSSA